MLKNNRKKCNLGSERVAEALLGNVERASDMYRIPGPAQRMYGSFLVGRTTPGL